MALRKSGSSGHSVTFHQSRSFGSYYELAWTVDFKYEGSRLRYPRRFTRHSDEKGASEFCERWNVAPPPELKAYHEQRLARKAQRAARLGAEQGLAAV